MKLFNVRPAVDGCLGERTVWKPSATGGEVARAEYVFDLWRGDCLLHISPIKVIATRAAMALTEAGITGFETQPLLVQWTREVLATLPGQPPSFCRLMVHGQARSERRKPIVTYWDGSDIAWGPFSGMIVTERCVEILQAHGLQHAVLRPMTLQA